MKKPALPTLVLTFTILMILFLSGCDTGEINPEVTPPHTSDETQTPTPDQNPEPNNTPEQKPEPTPERKPDLTPTPTSDPVISGYSFPFSFSAEDLNGDILTEEDLGQKELFLAYLWAVG